MESSLQASPGSDNGDSKAEFRKPAGDAANRKYRRRSPVNRSPSSSGDSPRRKRSFSPVSRRDSAKISDDRHRKEDRRELDRDYGRGSYARRDNQGSSRTSNNQHDDYERRDKYAEDIKRDSSKFSTRSDRDSRDRANSDYSKHETEHRSRDSSRDFDRYSRDKSDGPGYRNRDKDRDISYAGNQKYKDRDASDRVSSGRRHTSSSTEDVKDGDRYKHKEDRGVRDSRLDSRRRLDPEKYRREGSTKYDGQERYKDRVYGEPEEDTKGKKSPRVEGQDSPAKKPNLFSVDSVSGYTKDEKQPSSSNQNTEKAYVTDADIDAAKLAAVRAAELVNKNLVGTGYMSTEQKKKLLWGSKKSTAAEESAHRWDSTIFADREKQEKFNKLMSLRLLWCLWPIVGCEGRHQSREQARYQRCREGENSVGFREAVHCRAATKGWSHSWIRSLIHKESWISNLFFGKLYCSCISFSDLTFVIMMKIWCVCLLYTSKLRVIGSVWIGTFSYFFSQVPKISMLLVNFIQELKSRYTQILI
ncbi:hypothetical protein LIER_40250 [Lithospermum erythrorhizon]|uniref:Arginine/serine-rich coiled-coil protein 2 n=1 Tax=Lithospermum erythrorhizon TaxID=34254 RepID=A0AAV3QSS1_LITER